MASWPYWPAQVSLVVSYYCFTFMNVLLNIVWSILDFTCSKTHTETTKKQNLRLIFWYKKFVSQFEFFFTELTENSHVSFVYFSGFIDPKKVETYEENKTNYINGSDEQVFKDALDEINKYIADKVYNEYIKFLLYSIEFIKKMHI